MRRRKGDRPSEQGAKSRPDGTPAASACPGGIDGLDPGDDDVARRLRLLGEHAPVGLYLTDAAGDCIYANPAWCANAGLTSEQALGRGWLLGLHEDDRQEIAERWYGTVSRGERWDLEYRFAAEDGRVTWVHGTAEPVHTADGAPAGYAGMNLDITALKNAEEAARAGEASLKHAQLLAEVGSWEWDVAGERFSWSDEMYRIFGVERDFPLAFESISARLHLDDRARNNDWVIEALKREGPSEIDLRIVRPDGEVRHIHQRAVVEHDERGEPVRALGTIQDVTARTRAEAAARSSHARLSALLENADFAVWAVDTQGRLVVGNTTFHASVRGGLGHDVRPGDPLIPAELPSEVAEQWHAYYGRALSGERFSVEVPRRFTDVDGWMEYRFNPVTDPAGAVSGVMVIGRDITERRHLEDELRQTQELLEQAEAIARAGGWSYDAASAEVTWTDEVYRIYGVDRDFDVSDIQAAESFYGAEGRDAIAAAFSRAVEQGEPYDLELPFVRADGERLWVRTSARPVMEDGRMVRIIGTILDITQRKNAELALRDSDARVRAVADFTYDWEYWQDEDGSLLYVSPSCERITGYAPEELLTDPDLLAHMIHPEDRERFLRHHEDRPANVAQEPCSLEFRIVHRSGETRWIGHVCQLVVDEDGARHGVRGSNRDITAHRQADEALRANEALLRGLWDAMPSGCAIYEVRNDGSSGDDYVVKYFNRAGLRIEDKALDEVVGKSLRDLRPAIDDYGLIPVFQRVWQTGETAYYPSTLYVDEKYSNYYENSVFKLPSGEIVAIYNDVTERERAVEALRAGEERWRSLTETSPDHILTLDRNLDITYANFSSPGLTVDDLIGTPLWSYADEPRRADIRELHERVLRTGETASYETVYETPEGSSIYYEFRCVARHDPKDGAIIGLTVSARDITDRKRAEQALREAGERLAQAQLAADAGVWDWDMTTETLSWSPELNRLFGLPADAEASFDTWRSVLHPDDIEAAEARIAAAVEQHVPLLNEYRVVHPDGTVRWIRAHGNTAYNDAGRPRRMSGICVDITDQRHAEAQQRESEERFRTLVENVPGAVFRCAMEPPWNDSYVSESSTELTGYPPEDFMAGRVDWEQVTLPEDLERLTLITQAACDEQRSYSVEYRIRRRDGRVRWLREVGRHVRDEEGRPLYIDGLLTDITDQVRAEEALREKTREVEDFFAAALDLFCIADVHGYFRRLNKQWEEVLGYSLDELEGCRFLDLVHPDDLEATLSAVETLGRQEAVPTFINRYRCKDGSYRWIEWRSLPREGLIYAAARDITERRLADERLRESEERFRGVFETSATGIAIVDTGDQRFVDANDSFLAIAGYSLDELRRLSVPDITHPDDRQREAELIAAYAAGEVPDYVIEKRYVHKDGEIRWVRLTGDALRLEPGRPPLAVATVEDITESKRADDALREAAERLHATLSDTIKAMGNIVELRDPYTAGHERQVTRLANAIAEEMGVDAATREGLVMAGEVHDLGKIAVPAEILSKPSALTEMEFSLVKQHPVVGRELLSSIHFERPVAQIVGQHHERLDGSGYPDGLVGDEILLESRILAVADVVEAMAAHRPYRPALGIEAALAEVRAGAGTLYDADVVAACEHVIAAGFAVGSD